jgi:hypothetical protein
MWTRFIWPRIRSSDDTTFGLNKRLWISLRATIIFLRRTVFHGVSQSLWWGKIFLFVAKVHRNTSSMRCSCFKQITSRKHLKHCEIWGSHGGEDDDLVLMGCDTVWTLHPWRWRQYVSPKRWYLPTSPHGVTTQNNNVTWKQCLSEASRMIVKLEVVIHECNKYCTYWLLKCSHKHDIKRPNYNKDLPSLLKVCYLKGLNNNNLTIKEILLL